MELIFTLEQINNAATKFISMLNDRRVVSVSGEMGAGKTTFIQAVCRQMNVTDKMSSPTYSIINQYMTAGGQVIFHMDLYRIKDAEEAIRAGVEDALYSGGICFIEWPDKIADILPLYSVNVFLNIKDGDQRQLIVKFT